MYNGNGEKIEWWWRELGLPRELVLPESWAFRFICPPLSEAIQAELNIFDVNRWQLLLWARHSDLLPLHYHYINHYSIKGVLFHLECPLPLFHIRG